MSTLTEIRQTIAPELVRLNHLIASSLSSKNEMMNTIVDSYLATQGKQIRPTLVILSAKLFGVVDDRVIAAAAAIELLHNASLIHDDVVDETKQRRGASTINGVWDNHIAVLVGDYFVATSLQQALLTGDMRAIEAVAGLGRQLSIGELDQINTARYHTLSEEAYFNNIGHKTASLFATCVKIGGYVAGASDEQIEAIARFAWILGLCFQIRDDIFDYFADERIGKPTGNDLREGKITLPLLHVLLDDSLPDHQAMVELSQLSQLSADDISTLIDYAKTHSGIDYAYATMKRLRDEAVSHLDRLGDTEVTRMLTRLLDYTIDRSI